MVDPDNEERLLKVPPRVVADIEARVREDERSNNFTPDDHSTGMTEAYQRGLDAARQAVAALDHEPRCELVWGCDCSEAHVLECTCNRDDALAAIDALREKQ